MWRGEGIATSSRASIRAQRSASRRADRVAADARERDLSRISGRPPRGAGGGADPGAPWPVSDVTVRAYPDVGTFRDATGEPGWVAARTSGPDAAARTAARRDRIAGAGGSAAKVSRGASPVRGGRRTRERPTAAGLVERYGREAVLGWVTRGLPADIKWESRNHATTNRRRLSAWRSSARSRESNSASAATDGN